MQVWGIKVRSVGLALLILNIYFGVNNNLDTKIEEYDFIQTIGAFLLHILASIQENLVTLSFEG